MQRRPEDRKEKKGGHEKGDSPPNEAASRTAATEPSAPSAEAALREFHPPRPHNFARGALLSKRHLESLEATYRKGARQLAESFSALARQRVDVELLGVAQRTYSEFSHGLSHPTSLLLVQCLPRRQSLVLEIHPGVGLPLIEKVLGGSADTVSSTPRPLTRIEQSVLGLLAERVLAVLRETWHGSEAVTFDIAEFEHNPLLIQAIGPSEPALVLGFQLKVGRHGGRLHVCLPIRPFDDLILSSEAVTSGSPEHRNTAAQRQRILERLESAELTLSVDLASLPLDIGDVLSLKPGDVVATEIPVESEVRVTLDDSTTFRAEPVTRGGRRAVKIVSLDAES